MKYAQGSAFRMALEDRLRSISLEDEVPLVRLRKMVVFDRFLARLTVAQPGNWLLKGGFALQLRLGNRARTTKDIDLQVFAEASQVIHILREACQIDLKDWFAFEVENPSHGGQDELGGLRFQVHALLDGRPFETFHIDVGISDPVVDATEIMFTPALLKFAEIEMVKVPCYPLSQQIAEKLHAYTQLYASGGSSRVKDMVDMLLVAQLGPIDEKALFKAIEATFERRNTHPIPEIITRPPTDWERSFRKMAGEVGLSQVSLDVAYVLLQRFLNPILAGRKDRRWDPLNWKWN